MTPDFTGILAHRDLSQGRYCTVVELRPALYRLSLARHVAFGRSVDEWLYARAGDAIAAMEAWDPSVDPEPSGWFRHPGSERRRPAGDATREYVSG